MSVNPHNYEANKNTPLITLNMRLGDLVCQNYQLLLITTRYGIPLGFGERTIAQCCKDYKVDEHTLLLIMNLSVGHYSRLTTSQLKQVKLDSLIAYLSNSHSYFLDFRLPELRHRLLSAISNCPPDLSMMIRRFFDEYVEEVRKHMNYEDKTVFPYARNLEKGERDTNYSISIFMKKHDQVELKITELKNLLIRYFPASSGYELNNVLNDIFSSEYELAAHNLIEDDIFVPYIEMLEQA